MFSLKIHNNSSKYQHDIPYVSKVKPVNKIHAKRCNRNAIKPKKRKPERCQRFSGVYLFVKQNLSRHFLLPP